VPEPLAEIAAQLIQPPQAEQRMKVRLVRQLSAKQPTEVFSARDVGCVRAAWRSPFAFVADDVSGVMIVGPQNVPSDDVHHLPPILFRLSLSDRSLGVRAGRVRTVVRMTHPD
jgi:hypothetical protein